jgi:protein-disulfide isomerase
LRLAFTVGVVLSSLSSVARAEPLGANTKSLFTYRGKAYDPTSLPPAAQQTLYDMRMEYWERLDAFTDQVILDLHIDEQAKKSGKTRAQIEDGLFPAKEPTDKEVNDWYEANRSRLPPGYKLEQIAGDIRTLLKGEQKKKSRDELIGKLKREGKARLAFDKPVPPRHKIATDGFPVKGGANARVTLVEFADYQCPHCRAASDVLTRLIAKYGDKIRLVFLDFPINQSGISLTVAHGATCADEQGRFWDYHAAAFKDQATLDTEAPYKLATSLQLDETKFKTCMASDKPAMRVAKAKAEGERVGVTATPTIFINGQRVRGYEEDELEKDIQAALKGGA